MIDRNNICNNVYFKKAVEEEIDLMMVRLAHENLKNARDISEYVLYDVHMTRVAKALKVAECRTNIEDAELYKMIQKEAKKRVNAGECEDKVGLFTNILSNEVFDNLEFGERR